MGTDTYTASDGSKWHLDHESPPIPIDHFWSATHDDYDGAPDGHDDRYLMAGSTRESACEAVEEYVEEHKEEREAIEAINNQRAAYERPRGIL